MSPESPPTCTRRLFLGGSLSCTAHLMMSFATATSFARRAFAARQKGEVIFREPFGRLESVGEGVWALVSTPLEARQTLSNGGIIAGRDAVMAIEGLNTVEGASWMVGTAEELTGRRPTHLVLTHYHGDHSRGLAGFEPASSESLTVYSTEKTRDLLRRSGSRRGPRDLANDPNRVLADATMVEEGSGPIEVDLGGRVVRIVSRKGHTPSDLAVEVLEPRVVFCGDLVWNGMFPNYMDAIPSFLSEHCNTMLGDPEALYVPGHGALADADEMRPYLALLDSLETAARTAFETGTPAAEAAAEYSVPERLGEWFMFSPRYYEVAFSAWHRELSEQ